MDAFSLLKSHPLLDGFTDDGVKIIRAATTIREFPAGTPIFIEKMQGESTFLLVEGTVSLSLGTEDIIGTLEAPNQFGELALLNPGARRVSATAATDCTLLEVNRRNFQNLMKQRPQACAKFLMNITSAVGQRVIEASDVIDRILRKPSL